MFARKILSYLISPQSTEMRRPFLFESVPVPDFYRSNGQHRSIRVFGPGPGHGDGLENSQTRFYWIKNGKLRYNHSPNMADDQFKIYVEQLRDGHSESLNESYSPDFLDIKEKDLGFKDAVKIQGEAYLAEEMLVLHLDIKTTYLMPCRICNEPVKTDLLVNGFYHAIPLGEIKGAVFNFKEILRETILLEVPPLAECHQGKCPQRQKMKKYFKQKTEQPAQDEGYRPFADFDFENLKK